MRVIALPFLPLRYGRNRRGRNRIAAALLAMLAFVMPAAAKPLTVAALGDSLTQGYGLEQGDGLVPQLQAWLDVRDAGAVVLNAGVSGDTTAGGLARLDWTLTPEVGALIVALGGNDMLRGLDPATTRANLDAILDGADARGLPVLLVGLRAAGNYGEGYRQAFDAIFPELAAAHGALLLPDMFAPLVVADGSRLDTALLQADGIHPNAEGVKRIVAILGPKVLELITRAGG